MEIILGIVFLIIVIGVIFWLLGRIVLAVVIGLVIYFGFNFMFIWDGEGVNQIVSKFLNKEQSAKVVEMYEDFSVKRDQSEIIPKEHLEQKMNEFLTGANNKKDEIIVDIKYQIKKMKKEDVEVFISKYKEQLKKLGLTDKEIEELKSK